MTTATASTPLLGPRARRLIRSVARVVNPLVLRIAGRRHMPVVGILHHRGRTTGRPYATPLGARPAPAGGFVLPLTFGEAAGWYRNVRAAGSGVITWRGTDHPVADPVIVGPERALPAYPRYERLALRAVGISEFVWLRDAPAAIAGPGPSDGVSGQADPVAAG
ncbi:MAG TPA: nitroreductase family deazaflavin-dependent oxidoreductase [Streptosporangiaceae bacterium]